MNMYVYNKLVSMVMHDVYITSTGQNEYVKQTHMAQWTWLGPKRMVSAPFLAKIASKCTWTEVIPSMANSRANDNPNQEDMNNTY